MKLGKKRITISTIGVFIISVLFLIVASSAYADQIEIKWWDWETNPLGAKRVVFERAFEEYVIENPEIRIVAEHIPRANYHEKIVAGIAAGTGAIIAMISPDYRARYLSKDLVLIDPLPESLFPYEKLEQEYEQIEFFKWDDGKYYQISGGWDAHVMYYNRKIFDEKGVPLPTKWDEKPVSWEEFITLARKVTEVDANGDIVTAAMCDFDKEKFPLTLLYQFGGSLTIDNASKSNINTEAGLKTVELIDDLYDKYKLITPQVWDDGWDVFVNGRAAVKISEGWATDYLGNEENAALEMEVGPVPFLGKAGEPSIPEFYMGLLFPPSSPVIFSNFPEEEKIEAWKFIKFLYEEGYITDLALTYNQLPSRKADQWLLEEREFTYETTQVLKKYVPFGVTLINYPFAITETIKFMVEEICITGVEPAVALEKADKEVSRLLSEGEVWGIKDIR